MPQSVPIDAADVRRRQGDNLVLAAAFLAHQGVEFAVIGGCALTLHGSNHVPADLDVVPEPSLPNLHLLFDAITGLGSIGPVHAPTRAELETGAIVTRNTPIGAIDVFLERGREEYASIEPRTSLVSVKGYPVRVAAIDYVVRLRARFGKDAFRA